jgi:hypothetical protein
MGVFSAFGLPASLVIFIFVIDRLIEVIRAAIAFVVIRKAPWQMDLNAKQVKENAIVAIEPSV